MQIARMAAQGWQQMAASGCGGFLAMWSFVGLVSAYDAWLAVKYWETLMQLERNPLCQYFIALGDGDWSIFLRVKTSGTLAVLSVLAGLYRSNRRLALPIAAAVSAFQFGLLLYLTFAVPSWF